MKVLKCPVCGGKLWVDHKPKLGQRLECWKCVSQFEVVDLDPVEFDSIYNELIFPEGSYHNKYPLANQAKANLPRCPVCGSKVKTHHKFRQGDCITCAGCYVELTVVAVNPIVLDLSNNGNYNLN